MLQRLRRLPFLFVAVLRLLDHCRGAELLQRTFRPVPRAERRATKDKATLERNRIMQALSFCSCCAPLLLF